MDLTAKSQQAISDDQELAKVLAGVNQEAAEAMSSDAPTSLPPLPPMPTAPAPDPIAMPPAPVADPVVAATAPAVAMPAVDSELDGLKQEALGELRPLVDKLNVSPQEKFDTYLLLIRSTDDKSLLAPAHEAAKNITDEARRAEALLDIIKEIDFLTQQQQQ